MFQQLIGDEIEEKKRHLFQIDEAMRRTDPTTSAQIQRDVGNFRMVWDDLQSRQYNLLEKLQTLVTEKVNNIFVLIFNHRMITSIV